MADAGGRLAGKRALITGAASGIGRAVALQFDQEGASTCLVDRGPGAAREVAALASGPGRSDTSVVDLAETAELSSSPLAPARWTCSSTAPPTWDRHADDRHGDVDRGVAARLAGQRDRPVPAQPGRAARDGRPGSRVIVNVTTVGATRGFVEVLPVRRDKGSAARADPVARARLRRLRRPGQRRLSRGHRHAGGDPPFRRPPRVPRDDRRDVRARADRNRRRGRGLRHVPRERRRRATSPGQSSSSTALGT